MDKIILEARFDDITSENGGNKFRENMNAVAERKITEAELLETISALAQQVKKYHPRRNSEGYFLYLYAICRVKEVLSKITKNIVIIPILKWMESILQSGWTDSNADFLMEALHLLPRDYFTSMTKSQLPKHFAILNLTSFEFCHDGNITNENYVSDIQKSFARNYFFDFIDSKLIEESIDDFQDLLKTLYLKCWSQHVESINIFSWMIQALYRKVSNIYLQSPDKFIQHFEEITSKILKEDVSTTEGQTVVITFFSHNHSIIKKNKEVTDKIMFKLISTFLKMYKVRRNWTTYIEETLVSDIELSNISKTLDNYEELYEDACTVFMLMVDNRPVSPEDKDSLDKWKRLISSFSSNYFKNIIKTPKQFEKVIPALLKLIHVNKSDTTEIYSDFFKNLVKELPNIFKAKAELIIPFIIQFTNTSIFFGGNEDVTLDFPFGQEIRQLSYLYSEIKTLGKTTRAFDSPIVQDTFCKCFVQAFNNYSLCVSVFISNFKEFIIFKDYSAEDMLTFIQSINKTISMDLFHIYNPHNFSVGNLYSNMIEYISKSMKKYLSCIEEISKTPKILLQFNMQWDYNGEMTNTPSSTFLISIFQKFLMTKPDTGLVTTFYPFLLDVTEKSDESHGYYSAWISYLFSCPISVKGPEVLVPYIGRIIKIGLKILNSDLHANISIMLMGLTSICTPNPSCLLPYLSDLKLLCVEFEDKSTYFNSILGLYNLLYTDFPETIEESVVLIMAAKLNSDLGSACQVVSFLNIISKTNAKMLIPLLSEIFTCLETHKIYVITTIIIIFTNILLYDPNQGELIFESVVKNIEENIGDNQFLNGILYGLKSLGQIRHDLLVKLKDKIERWQKSQIAFNDMCQVLLDIIADRSLATLDEGLTKQKEVISQVDTRLVKTEVNVKIVEKDVKIQQKAIKEVNEKADETNVKVLKLENDVDLLDEQVQQIDLKTVSNAPKWAREVSKLMNPVSDNDWKLLASRLGYSNEDIRAWSTQADPCMSLLSEWFAVRRHVEATRSILEQVIEMNLTEVAKIIENALTAAEAVISDDDPIEFVEPPLVFLSYQWAVQEEVKVFRSHLQKAGYRCWMDIGQMGGGDKLYEAIDRGIRGAKVFIACVTEKYSQSPNCKRELNLSISLSKAVIPLQMEKMSWPPSGTMGPLLTEYIFIRMFGKSGGTLVEGTFWPKDRFQELLMQIRYSCAPEYENVAEDYKEWWIPPDEGNKYIAKPQNDKVETHIVNITEGHSPSVFISYQWGKQEQVKNLYLLLISKGISCWLDIYQMGGGDSLYDKIDRGIRECKVMICCVTPKYSESSNCRREVSLCDNLKKPLIPIMLEQMNWPPEGPMSMPLTQLIYISFVDFPEEQQSWKGSDTNELLRRINQIIPEFKITDSTSTVADHMLKSKSKPENKIINIISTTSVKKDTFGVKQVKETPLKKQSLNLNSEIKLVGLKKDIDKVASFAGNQNKNLGPINKNVQPRTTIRQKSNNTKFPEHK